MNDGGPGVLSEDRGAVRILTLNRPRRLNAFSTVGYDELRDGLVTAAADSSVKCLVLTGAGRAFCAGQDIHELEELASGPGTMAASRGFMPCVAEIEQFPKPLLAAVNGVAVGFGVTMLLHCDLVVASSEARFQLPFASLGLVPEAGSSVTLPLRVGEQEAAHLLYTGSWCDAEHAAEIGLVWRLASPERVMETALEIAQEIAAMPLASLMASKELLLAARLPTVRSARIREFEAFLSLLGGPANRSALTGRSRQAQNA